MSANKGKTPRTITCEEVKAAHAVHGNDMVKISREFRSSKDGNCKYFKNTFVKADGKEVACTMKVPMITINACKPPEKRKKLAKASFSFSANTVGTNDEPVGEAFKLLNEAWSFQAQKLVEEMKWRTNKDVLGFVSSHYENSETGDMEEMDEPLVRIKMRTDAKTGFLRGKIVILKPDGSRSTTTPNGTPISDSNAHTVVKSNSTAMFLFDFSDTMKSGQGVSNQDAFMEMYIVPGTGGAPSGEDEFDDDEFAAMLNQAKINGVAPEPAPAAEEEAPDDRVEEERALQELAEMAQ